MRKKGLFISVTLVAVIGIALFGSLFYLEKKDMEEYERNQQVVTEAQKRNGDKSIEDIGKQQKAEGNKNTDSIQNAGVPEDTENQLDSIQEQSTDTSTLMFAGDVYLSGYVTGRYDAEGINGVLDDNLLNQMQTADILMVNQEFPFGTTGTPAEDKQYTFRVNPSYVSILKDMGVDIVSLANNHVLDYGRDALQENFQTLENSEIIYTGAGESLQEASALRTMEAGGQTYGFLAASRVIPVTSWDVQNARPGVFTTYDKTVLVEAITEAKSECNFLTIYVHWGIERNTMPEAYQKELAHAYIDAGADLVIGAHPHVLQGIEAYNGKLIFYSLGNYIFNQSIEKTMLVKMEQQDNTIEYSVLPAYATGAKTMNYEDTEGFYSYLESLSQGIVIEKGKIKIK